ncbi:MAG: 3-hexulose-6-phosphate synthase [Candidatus Altiarchaeota archaeon]
MRNNPVLQLAIDLQDLDRALKVAREAQASVDFIEAGTPLINSEGMNAVRALKSEFPDKSIVADVKIMDAGRTEVEGALKSGADIVSVLANASDATIKECVEAAQNLGGKILCDLIGVKDPIKRAKQVERLGVDYISVHIAIDEQMAAKQPFTVLKKITDAVSIPVALAGGINSETASEAVKAGAQIIIVGGAITKAEDAKKAAAQIRKAISTKRKIKTKLFKRSTDVREILGRVSTANVSDAMHRAQPLDGIVSLIPGAKAVGQAVTVRTYPGDWAKPVEAIDEAKKGDVIVIDAGGVGPALWGELATTSAVQKKLSGVVVDGAVRDVEEILKMRFPVFCRLVSPQAGEPKGLGEIGVPVNVGGVGVKPGDWIIADDDGVLAIPQEKAVEVANRAMDILERENRIRKEIKTEKSTLSKVTHLLKWEKKS